MRMLAPQDSKLHAQLLRKSMDVVAQMQKAGVKILAGSDAPAPYVFPGFGLHDELQLLVEAGLTPLKALQSITRSPAEFLHVAKDSGTIEEGKIADLVLLEANPLDDIRNTRKIQAVIVHGKLLDRTALNQLLTDEKSFVDSH
jgi:imidazolonepropionase-like amidohydrolase